MATYQDNVDDEGIIHIPDSTVDQSFVTLTHPNQEWCNSVDIDVSGINLESPIPINDIIYYNTTDNIEYYTFNSLYTSFNAIEGGGNRNIPLNNNETIFILNYTKVGNKYYFEQRVVGFSGSGYISCRMWNPSTNVMYTRYEKVSRHVPSNNAVVACNFVYNHGGSNDEVVMINLFRANVVSGSIDLYFGEENMVALSEDRFSFDSMSPYI